MVSDFLTLLEDVRYNELICKKTGKRCIPYHGI